MMRRIIGATAFNVAATFMALVAMPALTNANLTLIAKNHALGDRAR
jgi:mannose/fructose-specific phosphotransferase system component IIA